MVIYIYGASYGNRNHNLRGGRGCLVQRGVYSTSLYLCCLTCISVHKKPRCGLWDSESADGQLPFPGLASGFSGSPPLPLHSELCEERGAELSLHVRPNRSQKHHSPHTLLT